MGLRVDRPGAAVKLVVLGMDCSMAALFCPSQAKKGPARLGSPARRGNGGAQAGLNSNWALLASKGMRRWLSSILYNPAPAHGFDHVTAPLGLQVAPRRDAGVEQRTPAGNLAAHELLPAGRLGVKGLLGFHFP